MILWRTRSCFGLGTATNWPKGRVHELIRKLSAFCELETPQTLLVVGVGPGLQYGTHLALEQVWQELDLSGLLRRHAQERTQRQFHVVPYLKAIIFQRLLEPGSKRECFQHWRNSGTVGITAPSGRKSTLRCWWTGRGCPLLTAW